MIYNLIQQTKTSEKSELNLYIVKSLNDKFKVQYDLTFKLLIKPN